MVRSGVDSDLQFVPAAPDQSTSLARSQVLEVNEQGFLAPLRAFDPVEMSAVREYIADLIRRVVDAPNPRNQYSVINYQLVCQGIYDLMLTPTLASVARDLLGPDLVCWNTHVFFKGGGGSHGRAAPSRRSILAPVVVADSNRMVGPSRCGRE